MARPRVPSPVSPPAPATGGPWPAGWLWAAVFALSFIAYLPALNGTLLWDDAGHVTRADLRSWDGLFRIWFEIGATQQYYPLLHSAFWIEHRLWGDATPGYHFVNVLLHATAAGLFGTLLRRLAVPGAWFAALLFALHPVCVESVAWIAEQKNTLSAVFYLAAALAYLRFDESRSSRHYLSAGGLFLLALLTKTVTATLPAALLVIFWWRRGRLDWKRDVLPLLPWLALGAASGLFTAHFEHALIGAQGADFDLGLVQRCLLAGRVFWFYLGRLAWPADLIFIYPRWTVDAGVWWQWLFPVAGLGLLGTLLWWQRRSRAPLAAALIFAGTLFPVLGFINIYPFLFSYVADHFQYLASLAVFTLVAAGFAQLSARLPAAARIAAGAVLLAVLGGLTWVQSAMYRDVFTLYETTLAKNPFCWMAHNNLAMALTNAGRVEEAVPHLLKALELRPDYPEALNNLGDDLVQLERPAEAIPRLERALQLQPNYALAHRNLGLALATSGRTAEAIAHFTAAARLAPADPAVELNWGIGLMLSERFDESRSHFEKAIRLAPSSTDMRNTYGRALAANGRPAEALVQFEAALGLDPNFAEGHLNAALALRSLGRTAEANVHYREAVRLNPAIGR